MTNAPSVSAITLLFTDIEGSTRLWEQHPDGMAAALEVHDRLLINCIEGAGGSVVKTMGDGLMADFESGIDAVSGALEAQVAPMNVA